jgi:hypothetical protein
MAYQVSVLYICRRSKSLTIQSMGALAVPDGRLHLVVLDVSTASGDRRVLPDAATLTALEGYTLLRKDRSGWTEIITIGQQMWVEAERKR